MAKDLQNNLLPQIEKTAELLSRVQSITAELRAVATEIDPDTAPTAPAEALVQLITAALLTKFTALQSDIADLSAKMGIGESALQDLADNVATLQSVGNDALRTISTLQSTVNTLKKNTESALADHESRIAALEEYAAKKKREDRVVALRELGYEDDQIEELADFDLTDEDFEYSCQIRAKWDPTRTSMKNFCKGDRKIKIFPWIDTSNVTDFEHAISDNRNLLGIPRLDFSNATHLLCALNWNTSLVSVPEINAPKAVYNGNYILEHNHSLKKVRDINIPNVTHFGEVFACCYELESFGEVLNIGTPVNVNGTFDYCKKLTKTPVTLDFSKVGNYGWFPFRNCPLLTIINIINLGAISNVNHKEFAVGTPWGVGSAEARQSLIDSLLTYSFDRAAAGYDAVELELSAETKAVLTTEELAAITAKGYTIA